MKSVKAWAVTWKTAALICRQDDKLKIFQTRAAARHDIKIHDSSDLKRVIRVEITPLPKKGRQ